MVLEGEVFVFRGTSLGRKRRRSGEIGRPSNLACYTYSRPKIFSLREAIRLDLTLLLTVPRL